jgi:hypothetical protein
MKNKTSVNESPTLRERVPSSPRETLAFSLLPALDWLRNLLGGTRSLAPKKTPARVRGDLAVLRETTKLS